MERNCSVPHEPSRQAWVYGHSAPCRLTSATGGSGHDPGLPSVPAHTKALSLVDPESWASVGALSQTDSACWPAFIFLFKTLLDKRAFGLKRSEKVILTSLFFWENGRKRRRHRAVCHNVVDFNIGCKITNAYNKQNIYSVLKSYLCSVSLSAPLTKCGWGIKSVRFKAMLLVIQTIKIYIACLLD